MKKTTYTLLIAMLCAYGFLPAQSIANWALTSHESPTLEADNVKADDMERGNGITDPVFDASGATANAWSQDSDVGITDYYEFCVSPKEGYSLHITGLSFTEQRNAEGIRNYRVKWSRDGFKTYSTIADAAVPDDEQPRSALVDNLSIRGCDGATICFRFYGYNAESYNGEWSLSDVDIMGSADVTCTPPDQQASGLVVVGSTISSLTLNWDNGDGDGTLIVGQAGSTVTNDPCSGDSYTADPVFGQGADIGGGAFVVYSGSGDEVTITGLTSGETYFFKAFEYLSNDLCYKSDNAPLAIAATLCHKAGDAPDMDYVAMAGKAYLAWDTPLCYDEILVVGSRSSIASVPTSPDGSDYEADAVFGQGEDLSSDFDTEEFPVYKGAANKATVTGLEDGETYYFRIYIRWGTSWSVGDEIILSPKTACVELNNDIVFINELHYHNEGTDIDEGVEIAGPAGVDLSHYALTFYAATGEVDTYIADDGQLLLSGVIDGEEEDFGAIWFPVPDLRYFAGIALWNQMTGEVVEFISWRIGSFSADEGIAEGMFSVALPSNVNQSLNTPVNSSLQRTGTGGCPGTLDWIGPVESSRGDLNEGQSMVLPISLTAFEGVLRGDEVLLYWETATEVNNDFMAVEHSTDGRTFEEVGRLNGKGNSNAPEYYELWHRQPSNGINYYRLRQVDFDGTTTFYGIVAIEYTGEAKEMLVFPTVTRNYISVEITGVTAPSGEITIVDTYGKIHRRLSLEPVSQQNISVEQLPAGAYYLVWENLEGERFTSRFFKQ
jgi:hypothetical protein